MCTNPAMCLFVTKSHDSKLVEFECTFLSQLLSSIRHSISLDQINEPLLSLSIYLNSLRSLVNQFHIQAGESRMSHILGANSWIKEKQALRNNIFSCCHSWTHTISAPHPFAAHWDSWSPAPGLQERPSSQMRWCALSKLNMQSRSSFCTVLDVPLNTVAPCRCSCTAASSDATKSTSP